MLIGVTVESTEQVPTAAVKTWNATAEDRLSLDNKAHKDKAKDRQRYGNVSASLKSHSFTEDDTNKYWLNECKDKLRHVSPVRPTFLRHIKQRFFLGFRGSGILNSSLPAVEGWEDESMG